MARSLAQQLATRHKQADAVALRQEGHSYEAIAAKTGYASASGAQKAVKRALAEIGMDEARELRHLQQQRLDDLLAQAWPIANDPTHRGNVAAVGAVLRIMDRMNRLVGLGA
jgi:hypothetical protein